MPGTRSWEVAHAKAVALVAEMTPEERANMQVSLSRKRKHPLTHDSTVGWPATNGCSGVTGSVPRLGWDGLCLADAGQGLRQHNLVNAYPAVRSCISTIMLTSAARTILFTKIF